MPPSLLPWCVLLCFPLGPAFAQTDLVGWGDMVFDSRHHAENFVAVATAEHSAGVRADGTLACWGFNSDGQCAVPVLSPGTSWVQVGVGVRFTAALRSD